MYVIPLLLVFLHVDLDIDVLRGHGDGASGLGGHDETARGRGHDNGPGLGGDRGGAGFQGHGDGGFPRHGDGASGLGGYDGSAPGRWHDDGPALGWEDHGGLGGWQGGGTGRGCGCESLASSSQQPEKTDDDETDENILMRWFELHIVCGYRTATNKILSLPFPMYTIYSKVGCSYCDAAKKRLDERGYTVREIQCDSLEDLREKLGPFAPSTLATFPFIVGPNATVIGGYQQICDALDEPLLQDSLARFSAFPVEHQDIFDLYTKAVACFWTADEITLRQDATDFQALSHDEQHFLKCVLGFFAQSDGIVNENLLGNFSNEVKIAEARQFYAFQAFNEAEHNRTYGMLIDALITDPTERDHLFNAIIHVPAVKKKAAWAMKWLDPVSRRFAERLVAFNCVEGILFSGSFCAIFWLKKTHRGKMPGLSLSNQFISRDEGLHCQHAAMLYRKLHRKLSQRDVEAIVGEAVANEKEFILEAIPCSLMGMNADLMSKYIEFVADRLLVDLGHSKMYFTDNPFPWMELISLDGKTNFFEQRVSEYQRAGIMDKSPSDVFALDDDF